jgi:aryl-alcohol dehydrogenase-like predicted oxidoreductase
MDYRHLGRTGLLVSPFCLGTMNFDPQVSERASHAIMDRALDCGINFVDTANRYGAWDGTGRVGHTEEIIGRWFAQQSGRREKVVLATKVYGTMDDWPNFSRLSALNIRRACEASLRRLQTDSIDLYQFHHIDRDTPWDEVWDAMERLVQEGKIIYVGGSNFAGWHIVQANDAARRRNVLGLVSEQSLYNLVQRIVELEVLPACRASGLGVIPYSPLAGGLLAGPCRRHRRDDVPASRPSSASNSTAPPSRRTKHSAPNCMKARPTSRWPGCWSSRPSLPQSPVRAPSSSSKAPSAASRSKWRRTCCSVSTRCSPVPVALPRRRTPGRILLLAPRPTEEPSILPPAGPGHASTRCDWPGGAGLEGRDRRDQETSANRRRPLGPGCRSLSAVEIEAHSHRASD